MERGGAEGRDALALDAEQRSGDRDGLIHHHDGRSTTALWVSGWSG
ncbi:hypothetical protein [Streptomyces sp. NPDC102476]